MRSLLALIAVLAALLLVACGEDDEEPGTAGALDVVATTTQAADLTRQVAGDRADVTGLLGPNTDPHEHEVRPSEVEALAGAALVVSSGGEPDEWLGEAIESGGGDPEVVTLIDHVQRRGDDPHWWQDPLNAVRAVAAIRDALTKADPAGREAYASRAAAAMREIEALDRAVAACVERIPADRRKLVTTHDALGYYAAHYGFEVVGAVIPSLSTAGQPSAGETRELIDTIRREKVPAIFTETSINSKVERAIAEEAGARLGRELYADTLGPAGSPGDTYLGSIAANTNAIADGLTGGELRCSLPT